MADYRNFKCCFWSDPDMEKLSPEDRYFYIYLLTNEHTAQCGIYALSYKTMAYETGYNVETVQKVLKRLEDKVRYNPNTNEIAIKNWKKHNITDSPKILKRVENELKMVKDKRLITYCGLCGSGSSQPDTVSGDEIGYLESDIGYPQTKLKETKEKEIREEEAKKYQPLLDLLKDMPIEAFPDDETALKTVARWGMVCPHVDIPYELMKMQSWLRCQPKGKYKDFPRFALNWLKRAETDAVAKLPKEEPGTPEYAVVGEWK